MFNKKNEVRISPVFPADHSMGSPNFLRYIRSKITNKQFALLSIAVSNNFRVECHSFFWDDLDRFLKYNKIKLLNAPLSMPSTYKKIANFKRPSWILAENETGQRMLIIGISPTKEYLLQYSSIVQSALLFLCPRGQGSASYARSANAAENMKIIYYPEIADNYSRILGLTTYLRRSKAIGDVYVIGEGDKHSPKS